MVTFQDFQAILITGASSGIGAALAVEIAARGVQLFLCGRNEARLQDVAERCRERGAMVEVRVVDVTESEAMAAWVDACDRRAPLDLVVANAGISGGTALGDETPEQVREIFAVNVDGVFNTVLPAIGLMQARGRGQIGIVSSMAGFRGMPSAPAYAASKAAVKSYGEGLRGWLAKDGIGVSVICPGFVKSRITEANRFPMPFLMEADKAARIIRKGLVANTSRIAFPWPMHFVSWLMQTLPVGLTDWVVARLPGK